MVGKLGTPGLYHQCINISYEDRPNEWLDKPLFTGYYKGVLRSGDMEQETHARGERAHKIPSGNPDC